MEMVTGAPRSELINKFLLAIAERDGDKGLKVMQDVGKANLDVKVFGKLLLEKMRAILLLRFAPNLEQEIKEEVGEDELAFLKELSGKKGEAINSSVLLEFLNAYDYLGKSAVPVLPLELALIKTIGQNG